MTLPYYHIGRFNCTVIAGYETVLQRLSTFLCSLQCIDAAYAADNTWQQSLGCPEQHWQTTAWKVPDHEEGICIRQYVWLCSILYLSCPPPAKSTNIVAVIWHVCNRAICTPCYLSHLLWHCGWTASILCGPHHVCCCIAIHHYAQCASVYTWCGNANRTRQLECDAAGKLQTDLTRPPIETRDTTANACKGASHINVAFCREIARLDDLLALRCRLVRVRGMCGDFAILLCFEFGVSSTQVLHTDVTVIYAGKLSMYLLLRLFHSVQG